MTIPEISDEHYAIDEPYEYGKEAIEAEIGLNRSNIITYNTQGINKKTTPLEEKVQIRISNIPNSIYRQGIHITYDAKWAFDQKITSRWIHLAGIRMIGDEQKQVIQSELRSIHIEEQVPLMYTRLVQQLKEP